LEHRALLAIDSGLDASLFEAADASAAPAVDLNGSAAGTDIACTLDEGTTSVSLFPEATISYTTAPEGPVSLVVTVKIIDLQDGTNESLSAFTTNTDIEKSYNSTTGTLTLTGEDTVANFQKVLRTITYANIAENPDSGLSRVIEVSIVEGTETSNTAKCTVTIVEPMNSVPTTAQSVNEDTDLVFSQNNNNLISINDTDAGIDSVRVTLTATHGTLKLAQIQGLSFSAGDGDADVTMTFSGTLADVNNALKDLTFKPDADYTGSATVQIYTEDQTVIGSGTPATDSDTINITVNAVNDKPQNHFQNSSVTTPEDTEIAFSAANNNLITVSDIDAGNSIIEVRLSATHGTLTLGDTTGLASNVGNGTAGVTIRGTVTAINNALNGMKFTPEAGYSGSATVQIETDDEGNTGSGERGVTTNQLAITVTAVNDAPTIQAPATVTSSECTELPFNTGSRMITIADVDAGVNLVQVTLSVPQGQGTLKLASTTDLTITAGANNTYTMTFTGTVAKVNAALSGLSFIPLSGEWTGTVTLTITVNDQGQSGTGSALSASKDVAITIDGTNDAPVLNSSGDAKLTAIGDSDTTNSGNTILEILSSVAGVDMITDADSNALEGIALFGTDPGSKSRGKWQYAITTDNGAIGTWTDVGTVWDASALLLRSQDRLRFVPNGTGEGTPSINFRAWDQTGGGTKGERVNASSTSASGAFSTNTETATIAINSVNDAPVLNTSGNPYLNGIAQNASTSTTTNPGTLVKDMINSSGVDTITDADSTDAAEGIAVTIVDNTSGRWQYSTDGTNFVDFTSTTGSIVNLGTAARLLKSDTTTRVRFVPNASFTGKVDAGLTFRAWDQTSGTNGGTADTTTNGSTTAFSTATETASITVGNNASIAGRVFVDSNNNGKFDTGENLLAFVRITLAGKDSNGNAIATRTVLTDSKGEFRFDLLPAGTYTLSQQQPAGYADGKDWRDKGTTRVDASGNDSFTNFSVATNETLTGFCFGELGLAPQYLSKRLLLSTAPKAGTSAWTNTITQLRANAEDLAGHSDIAAAIRGSQTSTTNQAPVISNQSFSVAENTAAGTAVGTVAATDPDAGQTLSYAVTAGNGTGAFAIDSTGKLTVVNASLLNYETTPTYTLTVKVTDNGTSALSDEATITVNLSNVNESPVVENQTFSVAENTAAGTAVGTVAATDPDAGQTLSYAITAGNGTGAFAIDSTGKLTVVNASLLNYETTPTYTLTVKVTDNGTSALSDEATITVNLSNVNEAPVVENQTFTVAENSANGTNVGTVAVSDPDVGQTFTYAITAGNGTGAFAIDSTGKLTVANASLLDFETTPSYTLTVRVTDNGNPAKSTDATITVNLSNVNEAPVVENQSFTVAENSVAGTVVHAVAVTQVDAGETLTYSITAGNGAGAFSINSNGELVVADASLLNHETTASYTLTVKVTDSGDPAKSDEATITVTVSNVNETPVMTDKTFSLPENSEIDTLVGTMEVSDPDVAQQFTYSIIAGDTAGVFAINSSGQLTLANPSLLDIDATPSYTLTVKVTDSGDPAKSDEATITVNLQAVDAAFAEESSW
jgi:VCBS repeat-containing protein